MPTTPYRARSAGKASPHPIGSPAREASVCCAMGIAARGSPDSSVRPKMAAASSPIPRLMSPQAALRLILRPGCTALTHHGWPVEMAMPASRHRRLQVCVLARPPQAACLDRWRCRCRVRERRPKSHPAPLASPAPVRLLAPVHVPHGCSCCRPLRRPRSDAPQASTSARSRYARSRTAALPSTQVTPPAGREQAVHPPQRTACCISSCQRATFGSSVPKAFEKCNSRTHAFWGEGEGPARRLGWG